MQQELISLVLVKGRPLDAAPLQNSSRIAPDIKNLLNNYFYSYTTKRLVYFYFEKKELDIIH